MTTQDTNYYQTIHDASRLQPALSAGDRFSIWFCNASYGKDLKTCVQIYGVKGLLERVPSLMPTTLEDLPNTHSHLGDVSGTGVEAMEQLQSLLQDANWAPAGQASRLLHSAGTAHASMTFGDVVVENNIIWMVDQEGFYPVGLVSTVYDTPFGLG